jgi:hypothetical protein
MTDATLLTGKRGTGKSLNAVKTIQRYMQEGRVVATNLDLYIDKLLPPASRAISYRIPDVPLAELLNHPEFPQGNPNPIEEDRNGLLVLDECAGYINAREWKDSGRTDLILWLAQSRKNGWDLLFLAQGASMIDKQVRTELCDMHGICRETSKIGIPFVTAFFRSTFGIKVMMPKFHIVSYYYGFGANAVRSFVDMYRTSDVRNAYNTLQKINLRVNERTAEYGQQGISCNLSAWHLRGRYMSRFQMYGRLAIVSILFGFAVGAAAGYFGRGMVKVDQSGQIVAQQTIKPDENVFVTGAMHDDEGATLLILSDGRTERPIAFKADLEGTVYKVGTHWYSEKK